MVVVALVLVGALTSCSRYFFVIPFGSLATNIRFEFRDAPDEEKSSFRIREFAIFSVDKARVDSPAWSLDGLARVSAIEYGVVPNGLTETEPATPLVAGRVYYVQAADKPLFSSIPGHASAFFAITDRGEVKKCEQLECASIASGV